MLSIERKNHHLIGLLFKKLNKNAVIRDSEPWSGSYILFWSSAFYESADNLNMTGKSESLQLWYDSVVKPKLKTLSDLSLSLNELNTFDHKKFFKEFLADLELLSLDNYRSENQIEKISFAIEFLKKINLDNNHDFLKEMALISSLTNSFDKLLFFTKWQKHLKFKKSIGPIDDEIILDAYRLPTLIRVLVDDINQRAQLIILEAGKKSS